MSIHRWFSGALFALSLALGAIESVKIPDSTIGWIAGTFFVAVVCAIYGAAAMVLSKIDPRFLKNAEL